MKKPNILLITGDHTRHDAIACNHKSNLSSSLASSVKTPNFDRLASEGVSFENSFTPNPICVPGRASITTGNYSHKCTGAKTNGGRIKDNQIKIAEHFSQNGYKTCAIGKLHYVPYSGPGQPRLVHGFEHAELCEEGRIISLFGPDGNQKGLEDYHDYLTEVDWHGYERAHGIGNNDVHPAPSAIPAEHHEEAWVVDRSIAFIDKHIEEDPEQPFMMWSSFIKPHSPYDPPRPYDTMYDPREMPLPLGSGKGDELLQDRDNDLLNRNTEYGWDKLSKEAIQLSRAYYCGMMSYQDAMLGRLLDYLEEKNLLANTVILYSADHGDLLGDFDRYFKTNMLDSSVMVPFILRAPGIDNHNNFKRQQLVGLQDILPTLSSLAGIDLPETVDGIDVSPYISNPESPGRDFYISQTASSKDNQKYMLRTQHWKYIYCQEGGTEELYDVRKNDYELHNLALDPSYSDLKQELRQQLIQWCQDNHDNEMLTNNKLKKSPLKPNPAEMNPKRLGWRKY